MTPLRHLLFLAGLLVSVFPLAAAVRLATRGDTSPKSSLSRQDAVTNGLLTLVCAAELPLFKWNRMAGLSAFVLARKP